VSSWVTVRAPVRVLDAGGWSDTWFAVHGTVCHLSVGPGTQVRARAVRPASMDGPEVRLELPDFKDSYRYLLAAPPGRHPILEVALRQWAPPGASLEVEVSSAVPPGSSLGTSASVVVALVAALQALGGVAPGPADLARAAHEVEAVHLGRQSGVQDQVAAAFGGINLVRVDPYPRFEVTPLALSAATLEALRRRVVTVYLGAHDSSAVHETVIAGLGQDDPRLGPIRVAATRAAAALVAGDLGAYGEAMTSSSEGQAALHASLVNDRARRVMQVAADLGAIGWKVNGAGGAGGTVTIIGPEDPAELVSELTERERFRVLSLRVEETGAHIVTVA